MAGRSSRSRRFFSEDALGGRVAVCFCQDEEKGRVGTGIRARRAALLCAAMLLGFVLHGCAAKEGPPKPVEGSMLMGRVLINNSYRGRNGLIPLGLQAKSIQIEIRSEDSERMMRRNTDEEGYFFVPNLAPGDYYLHSVGFDVALEKKTDGMRFSVRFLKARVGVNTVTYLGTLVVEVSREGEYHFKELHDAEKARQRLLKTMGGTGWEACEFVSAPPSSVIPPAGQLPGVKKNKPGAKANPAK